MKPIIYNGEEYKDKLIATTKFKPSLRMRLLFLFCTSAAIEHELYTKEIMPAHKAIGTVHIMSVRDSIRSWWWNKKGYGQMVAPSVSRSCDSQ